MYAVIRIHKRTEVQSMVIKIPWNRHYYDRWWVFRFVPKTFVCIRGDGFTWEEKNEDARFKIHF